MAGTDNLIDAKGDILAGTAADTVDRVAVGADGLFLKADSAAGAGVSWDTPAGGTDIFVKVTSADTTADYLDGKVNVTAPLIKAVGTPAGDESLELSLAALDATDMATVADDATTAGVLVCHPVTVPSGAAGNVDIVIDDKIEVIEMVVRSDGSGTTGDTVRATNGTGANHITDAVSLKSASDGDLYRSNNITTANAVIAAAGTLRITSAVGGTFPGCQVWIYAVRRA